MHKLGNYVLGQWQDGQGEGKPLYHAITGEVVATATTDGLDFGEILAYGRKEGSKILRGMTFYERGVMLKRLAVYLTKRKEQFYDISYQTGATRLDSWVDIEGGFGNLFANASLRRNFPNLPYHVDGEAIDLSRGGSFMGHHIMVPKRGVAVHINAFNFPVWGMLEKCAVNWMAGVPAVVKPATATAQVTEAVARAIIESGILPEGALQLICGSARSLINHVASQDVVTFTGSADTGRLLKANPRIIHEAVPFNMEADSLNCTVLGEDAVPGTPEFDLFIKEIRKEMTIKCGQRCTAIRRVLVPAHLVEDVQIALSKSLAKVTIGNPHTEGVRMGALVNKDQVQEVRDRVQELARTAEIVYGQLDRIEVIGADAEAGAFLSPIVMLEKQPFQNQAVHEIEAFGPVTTLMPYQDMDEAIALAQAGKGSLCCSITTFDDQLAREFVIGAASHHGRILVLNRESAKQSTGHGSPLATLVHGGPGRAGGGEEMGGMRGVKHYMQRCAIQGTPTTIAEITQTYQPGAKYKPTEKHPFQYHFEDIQMGMSLQTHRRTVTDSDIINFANLTWDHFYAHTDITSLKGTIFEKRAAHGYFLLSAAAGLFVYPGKGPVSANYGLESCRFIRPVYHNDTIYARLTCKEKQERDAKGREHPAGIVKWYAELFDQDDELVAIATVLTLVRKKSPFMEVNRDSLQVALDKLTEDTRPAWGILTPQHMVEHLEYFLHMAVGKIETEITTPPERIEKFQESLYNHRLMPRSFDHPQLRKGAQEDLRHESLSAAKAAFFEAYDAYETFFKEHPEITTPNTVFGMLDKELWDLNGRKHFTHHFTQFGLV